MKWVLVVVSVLTADAVEPGFLNAKATASALAFYHTLADCQARAAEAPLITAIRTDQRVCVPVMR